MISFSFIKPNLRWFKRAFIVDDALVAVVACYVGAENSPLQGGSHATGSTHCWSIVVNHPTPDCGWLGRYYIHPGHTTIIRGCCCCCSFSFSATRRNTRRESQLALGVLLGRGGGAHAFCVDEPTQQQQQGEFSKANNTSISGPARLVGRSAVGEILHPPKHCYLMVSS